MNTTTQDTGKWRLSRQPLLPLQRPSLPDGYDIYPAHSLAAGKVHAGYDSLAAWIAKHKEVLIDGYTGIFWEEIQQSLQHIFTQQGLRVKWQLTTAAMKEEAVVREMIAPFTGQPGTVWGTRTTLRLADFFYADKLHTLQVHPAYDITITLGTGASLIDRQVPLIYLDIPKNELQYRMRADAAFNLGCYTGSKQAEMYKQAYFVDWVVLNEHKRSIADRISIFADTQFGSNLTWITAADLKEGIQHITRDTFRVRPWFEAGAWGGQWMKQHIPRLPQDEVNLAWSFEMIVPENGVLFESDGYFFEIPFEWLMYLQHKAILGTHADIFRYEFPIRFDFLDTFDGGNLSIQCHPSLSYVREKFGETFTQDETYYILDCKPGAGVYLGFTEDIDPVKFRTALEESNAAAQPLEITDYVQLHAASMHDLFLIPNGTVHSAGANNLVLEISATPYIFTFKMYDWVRMGLDGQPRPINIDHAFHNLDFSRKGGVVRKELISAPSLLEKGADWQLWHLPTHREHFYDVQRVELETNVSFHTSGRCFILMLVEGTTVAVKTANGKETLYQYAETFVIPAAAESFTLINKGRTTAKVIIAFLKEEHPVYTTIRYETTI